MKTYEVGNMVRLTDGLPLWVRKSGINTFGTKPVNLIEETEDYYHIDTKPYLKDYPARILSVINSGHAYEVVIADVIQRVHYTRILGHFKLDAPQNALL